MLAAELRLAPTPSDDDHHRCILCALVRPHTKLRPWPLSSPNSSPATIGEQRLPQRRVYGCYKHLPVLATHVSRGLLLAVQALRP
jgi:hypothetical protein